MKKNLTLNLINEVLIQDFLQLIELISFEMKIYLDLIYKFYQILKKYHLVMYHIRLIILPNLYYIIKIRKTFLFSYHFDKIMKKEVHYKDSESYPMLTNLNENQYQEVSNIDPMTKKFHLEKKD